MGLQDQALDFKLTLDTAEFGVGSTVAQKLAYEFGRRMQRIGSDILEKFHTKPGKKIGLFNVILFGVDGVVGFVKNAYQAGKALSGLSAFSGIASLGFRSLVTHMTHFLESMDDFRKEAGMTRKEMFDLTEHLLNVGARYGVTLAHLGDIVRFVGTGSMKTRSEIEKLAGNIGLFARTTGQDVAQAAESWTDFQDVLQLDTDTTNRLRLQLVAAAREGHARIPEMQQRFLGLTDQLALLRDQLSGPEQTSLRSALLEVLATSNKALGRQGMGRAADIFQQMLTPGTKLYFMFESQGRNLEKTFKTLEQASRGADRFGLQKIGESFQIDVQTMNDLARIAHSFSTGRGGLEGTLGKIGQMSSTEIAKAFEESLSPVDRLNRSLTEMSAILSGPLLDTAKALEEPLRELASWLKEHKTEITTVLRATTGGASKVAKTVGNLGTGGDDDLLSKWYISPMGALINRFREPEGIELSDKAKAQLQIYKKGSPFKGGKGGIGGLGMDVPTANVPPPGDVASAVFQAAQMIIQAIEKQTSSLQRPAPARLGLSGGAGGQGGANASVTEGQMRGTL